MTTDRKPATIRRMRPATHAAFVEFCRKVENRLRDGARVYGDSSLDLPTPKLLTEIQEELEDVAGWSILLWARLERIRKAHEEIRSRFEEDGA